MLTFDMNPTSGYVLLDKHLAIDMDSSLHGQQFYGKNIGYCPQFDALYDELTPADHLKLFARLKGVKTKNENTLVNYFCNLLDFDQYKNMPVSCMSLGNRRKLSIALALVGNPSVILLDEPTSGMVSLEILVVFSLIRSSNKKKNFLAKMLCS
jgi:ATP-binding cassette subfamily A (ABC1) protein 3